MKTKTKVCSRCGKRKKISEFGLDGRNKVDGLQAKCKKCDSEAHRLRYLSDESVRKKTIISTLLREKLRIRKGLCRKCNDPAVDGTTFCQEHREVHQAREKARREVRVSSGLCQRCGKRPPLPSLSYCGNCSEKETERCKQFAESVGGRKVLNQRHKNHYEKCREQCFEHYGKKCFCCGESIKKFLTIDHINNDGAAHKRAIKTTQLYRWLVQNDFPEGFQTACYNCNCARHRNGGICPHKERANGNTTESEAPD